ncbi:MAG TPA: FixH family protein [Terriglobales bacterium]|nr:FixH family protein [Terriglobales bacterium]
MTRKETNLVIIGAVLGTVTIGITLGAVRKLWSWTSAARAEEPLALQYAISSPTSASEQVSNQHEMANEDASTALAGISLTEDEQRSTGLQTTRVERRQLRRELVAPARVEEPETQLMNISARIGGRIDKLYVDFTGQPVRRGQPIADIYSPEVLTSAEEYRLALESRKRLGAAAEPQALAGADDLIAASRRRLELWGLTEQQIVRIPSSAEPQVNLTIYSPASGIVRERRVTRGQYVNVGDVLYTVSDLSSVWIKADIYPADLAMVHVGEVIEVISDSLPNTKLRGRVGFVEPVTDPQTRTTAARIQVANPGMKLRPGMFVQVRLQAPATSSVVVPRTAVIDTGARKLVYVAKGGSDFEAREVRLGTATDEYYPVLSGLRGGEQVVTQGSFQLDSQTRITGGMTGMFGGSKEFQEGKEQPARTQATVSLRADPSVPLAGSKAALHVTVTDASGRPITGAQVRVTLFMPAMPAMGMGEMRESATLQDAGKEYVGSVDVPMSGTWTVTVEAQQGNQALATYRTTLRAK